MRSIFKGSAQLVLLFTLTISIFPALCQAAVAVQPEVVSGRVVQIFEDKSIKLDNDQVYFPSRQGLTENLAVGEPVTVRYVVKGENKNFFFEVAPGLNTLENAQPTSVRNEDIAK